MRRIPERGSCLPGVVGVHGVARGAIRASDSNGSGLEPASIAQIIICLLDAERWWASVQLDRNPGARLPANQWS